MKKPWWQRRLESSIEMWFKHLSQVEKIRNGKTVSVTIIDDMIPLYISVASESMEVRLLSTSVVFVYGIPESRVYQW